jgi:hypothetical protein
MRTVYGPTLWKSQPNTSLAVVSTHLTRRRRTHPQRITFPPDALTMFDQAANRGGFENGRLRAGDLLVCDAIAPDTTMAAAITAIAEGRKIMTCLSWLMLTITCFQKASVWATQGLIPPNIAGTTERSLP